MNDNVQRTVGILGYGAVGRYLSERILHDPAASRRLRLAFVYNRDPARVDDAPLPERFRFSGPDAGAAVEGYADAHGPPDLIVEVCHPDVLAQCGARFLDLADVYAASVSALADSETASRLNFAATANAGDHGLYLPAGAAWGIEDIARMNRIGTLDAVSIAMTFHVDALRPVGALADRLRNYRTDDGATAPVTLFEGSVAELAPLAPNNVNTMACLALAASRLGPAGTGAKLVAQKDNHEHVVEIAVRGPDGFRVTTRRVNPARPGAVTGQQTYATFLASLLEAGGKGSGLHFC